MSNLPSDTQSSAGLVLWVKDYSQVEQLLAPGTDAGRPTVLCQDPCGGDSILVTPPALPRPYSVAVGNGVSSLDLSIGPSTKGRSDLPKDPPRANSPWF